MKKSILEHMYVGYFKLDIHQRINARQMRNGLNINYLFKATMESVNLAMDKEIWTDNFSYCPNNNSRLWHKNGKQHSKYPSPAKLELESIARAAGVYHLKHFSNGGSSEFDKSINELSRNMIETMVRLHGHCYLWKINRHSKDEPIWKIHNPGDRIFNFECELVTPRYDKKLYALIKMWSEYNKIIPDKWKTLNAIFDRVEEIGGYSLSWA